MTETRNHNISKHIAETAAGAVRLVSLRLTGSQEEEADKSRYLERHIRSFLDREVRTPFRYKQISRKAFALNGQCDRRTFDLYTLRLHDRLIEFLFGSEGSRAAKIIVFSGTEAEVAEFISEPEDKAAERSRRYLQHVLSLMQADEEETIQATGLRRDRDTVAGTGQRPLFYRGILLSPHQVMVAYAITPGVRHGVRAGFAPPADIDLATYLSHLGGSAIDFSLRIFDAASQFLQSAPDHLRSVVLLVPLSYHSLLSHQDRERFLLNARQQPEWVRNQIFLSVFCAPPQPGSTLIQRFSSEYSSLFRSIDWQVTRPDFDLDLFVGCRLHSVTFDLHTHQTRRLALIRKFAQRIPDLKRLKVRSGISGLNSLDERALALDSGLSYLSGNAITAPLSRCAPARTITLDDLPLSD